MLTPLNSRYLREKYPELYTQWFRTHSLIVSTAADVPFLNDYNHWLRGTAIKQKITLRIYGGISPQKSSLTTFFEPVSQNWQTVPTTDLYPLFPTAWQNLQRRYTQDGLQIDWLCEIPRGFGFSPTAKMATLATTILAVHSGEVNNLDFNHLESSRLMEEAVSFLSQLRPNDTNLCDIICSFSHSCFPDYYMHKELFPLNQNSRKIRYGNYSQIFSPATTELPFDYYYIFPGQRRLTVTPPNSALRLYDFIPDLSQTVEDKELCLTHSLANDSRTFLYNLSFKTFQDLGYLLEKPISTTLLANWLADLRQYDATRNFLEPEKHPALVQLKDELKSLLFFHQCHQFAILNNGNFHGGCLTLITERETDRRAVKKSFESLKKHHPYVTIPFVSYRDGWGEQGLVIEQRLPTLTKSLCLFDINGQDFPENALADFDLVLDFIRQKIVLRGQYMDSRQLRSQRMTLEIFRILLTQNGQDVSNQQLPASSYTLSKNEMQGKILLPLRRHLRTLGLESPLVCRGSETNFWLSLIPSQLKLGILTNASDPVGRNTHILTPPPAPTAD